MATNEGAKNSRQLKGLKWKTQKALDGEGKDPLVGFDEDGNRIVNLGKDASVFSEGSDGSTVEVEGGQIKTTGAQGGENIITPISEAVSSTQITEGLIIEGSQLGSSGSKSKVAIQTTKLESGDNRIVLSIMPEGTDYSGDKFYASMSIGVGGGLTADGLPVDVAIETQSEGGVLYDAILAPSPFTIQEAGTYTLQLVVTDDITYDYKWVKVS